jgi:hypothetical protein
MRVTYAGATKECECRVGELVRGPFGTIGDGVAGLSGL